MRVNKTQVMFAIIAISFCIILLILFGSNTFLNTQKMHNTNYLILDSYTVWSEYKDNWEILDKKQTDEIFATKEFQLYSNNKYVSTSKIKKHKNSIQYLTDEHKWKTIYPIILGFSSNNNSINVAEFKEEKLNENDISMMKKYLDDDSLRWETNNSISVDEKVSFDFDQDGEIETVYIYSNLYVDELETSNYKSFQLILYQKNDTIQVVLKNIIPKKDEYELASANSISSIVQMKKDATYDIILTRYRPMGGLTNCYALLSLRNNKWVEMKTCQEVES